MRYKLSFIPVALFAAIVFMSFKNESLNLEASETRYGGSASVTSEYETWIDGEKVIKSRVISETVGCYYKTVAEAKAELLRKLTNSNIVISGTFISDVRYDIDSCE